MKYYAIVVGYTREREYFAERSRNTFPKVDAWNLAYKMENAHSRVGNEVRIIGIEPEKEEEV